MKERRKRICVVFGKNTAGRTHEPRKPLYLFICTDKKTKEIKQGIAYTNGTYNVGYDCWRSLNKMDCCSYPVRFYRSNEELKNEIVIVKENRQKAYYLSETEEHVC